MFTIRQAQLDAFDRAARSDFERRADRYLCANFPDRFARLPPERRQEFIRQSVTGAARYQLTSEQAVVCFAHLCLLLGEGWEADPKWDWAPRMLKDEAYDQSFRAKLALHTAADIKAAGV